MFDHMERIDGDRTVLQPYPPPYLDNITKQFFNKSLISNQKLRYNLFL